MGKHVRYASYVWRHKWFVFVEACRLGIPWLGVVHDLSKFRPSEWGPYVESFYGGPHREWKDVTAGEKYERCEAAWRESKEGVRAAFDLAWLLHQKRNKHHWQWWLLAEDDGGLKPLPMPDRYRREMLADWRGAGKAQGNPDTRAWYLAQRAKGHILMHPETRQWIEEQLGI